MISHNNYCNNFIYSMPLLMYIVWYNYIHIWNINIYYIKNHMLVFTLFS